MEGGPGLWQDDYGVALMNEGTGTAWHDEEKADDEDVCSMMEEGKKRPIVDADVEEARCRLCGVWGERRREEGKEAKARRWWQRCAKKRRDRSREDRGSAFF